jgi:Terpene cyclase DEP1
MSSRLVLLVGVLVAFGVLSTLALLDVGYFGIIAPHFQSYGGGQVFADLCILAVMACIWMANDARTSGLPAWPFIVMTVFLGSFGPLFYLLLRELRATVPARTAAR